MTDLIIAKSIYCEQYNYENILWDIGKIKKDGAYNSTHILFAFIIMREKGCYDQLALNTSINGLVENLTKEQDNFNEIFNYQSSDVYAERAALISYAGYALKETWISNLASLQSVDGSWFSNPHTTSLALWVIAQKNKNCN